MHRVPVIATVALATALLTVGQAFGGSRIRNRPSCAREYMILGPGAASERRFRASLQCLINAARRSERLPALRGSRPLTRVATAQSNAFARTGRGSHGPSLAAIGQRFRKAGYRPAAYDEAFDVLPSGATPYWFLSSLLSQRRTCSQILDPRFRDIGIDSTGVLGGGDKLNPFVFTLALELGRRAGQGQPSARTAPAASCPHRIPAPVVEGFPVKYASITAHDTGTISYNLKCQARVPCTLSAALTLPGAKASATVAAPVTIPAGKEAALTFSFTPGQVAREEQGNSPGNPPIVDLTEHVSAPVVYTRTIEALLPSATN